MLLKEIRERFRDGLQDTYPNREIDSLFYILIAHYLGFPKTVLALEPDKTLNTEGEKLLLQALQALKENCPVQYITGSTFFMDMELKVTPAVLIPRPETEELLRWILESHTVDSHGFRVLDVGTGSGCLALGIKRHLPAAEVYAMDISVAALEVARANAGKQALEILFKQDDISEPGVPWPLFDLIISNPPYVPLSDRSQMMSHVKDSEPYLALFVPDADPLVMYRHLCHFGVSHLKKAGWIYLEIYEESGPEVAGLLKRYGFADIEQKKDIFGKDRFVRGRWPGHAQLDGEGN